MVQSIIEKLIFNHVGVEHPFVRTSKRFCPIEEIAQPEKLEKCFIQKDFIILPFKILGGLTVAKVQWIVPLKTYEEFATCSMFFYVIGDHDIITEPFDLLKHHAKRFIITCPVWYTETNYGHGEIWSMSRSFPQNKVRMGGVTDAFICAQLVHSHCLTICNGLTVALAMNRLGKYTKRKLTAELESLEPLALIAELDEKWVFIYIDLAANMPFVAEIPDIYALSGCDNDVVQFIKSRQSEVLNLSQAGFIVEYNSQACTVYANTIINTYPKPSLTKLKHVFETYAPFNLPKDHYIDCQAYMEIMGTCSNKQWAWWLKVGLDKCRLSFKDVLPAAFYVFNYGVERGKLRSSRMRTIWQNIIADKTARGERGLLNNWVRSYCIKFNMEPMGEFGALSRQIPAPPIAFFKDLQFKALAAVSPIYKHILTKSVTSYLLVLKHIQSLDDPNAFLAGTIVEDYFRQNPHLMHF